MQQGWVSIHRSILDHFVWKDKPFNMGAAWVDLILMANHDDKKILINGTLQSVKRSQTYTSCRTLAERWGWSLGKVKRFIDVLETEHMVTAERTKSGTLLTLVNYGTFQDIQNTNGTRTERRRNTNGTPTEHQRNTNGTLTERNNNINNDNNENNVNNETKETLRYFPSDEALEKTFADFRDMRKKIRKPMTDRAIELMIRKLNKYDPDIAIKMLEQSIVNCWQDVFELKDNRGGRETKIESIADRWSDVN